MLPFARDRDVYVRQACATLLRRFPSRAATEALSRLLRDEDQQVQLAAARSLGDQKTPEALEALKRAIGSRSHDLRVVAAIAIGKVVARLDRTADGQELLLQLTRDSNAEVRAAVYEHLPDALPSTASLHLVRGLRDRKTKVRLACARSLGKLSGPSPPELVAALRVRSLSWEAAKALVLRGDTSIAPAAIAALNAKQRWQRLSGVALAGELLLEDTVPALEAIRHREQRWWPRCIAWLESRIADSMPYASVARHRLELQSETGNLAKVALYAIRSGKRLSQRWQRQGRRLWV